ncbi:MAG: hypothetical protein H6626_02745 [Pseudobdellovibrionaceae bacterium]|nr:MAG: hypothetical protein H6626_02745 [Pseudobdellovibrionaceae bacterium]
MTDNKEFDALFLWNQRRVEDVRFWCEPELSNKAIEKIAINFDVNNIDGFVALEARGFFLAGMATQLYKKPSLVIRKHKNFYDKMEHKKIEFFNWKNEKEALTILKNTIPKGKNFLIVDDIIDTGASLRASNELMKRLDLNLAGAFYLLNSIGEEGTSQFDFPIKSLLTRKLFT